jgi:GntR family transcriptional regulator
VTRGRKRGIPLYYQVMRTLKGQILEGELKPGERLPSEADLTLSFRVSRVVVRQALKMLEDEGLIVRVKGRGTFVSPDAGTDKVPCLSGYLEDLIRIGLNMEATVLEFGLRKAGQELAELFEIPSGSDVFFVKRLRMVDHQPFSVIHNFVPYDIGSQIPLRALEDEPLMQLIESRAGVEIDWASEVFQAISADEELSRLLEVDLVAPVLKMTLTAYSDEGRAVNLAHVFYRSDRYNYRGHLKRRRTEEFVGWIPMDITHLRMGR